MILISAAVHEQYKPPLAEVEVLQSSLLSSTLQSAREAEQCDPPIVGIHPVVLLNMGTT